MNSKESILSNIRRNIKTSCDLPELDLISGIQYSDKLEQFINISHTVGGEVHIMQPGEDLNEQIRKHFPDAKAIASNLPEIIATINPDHVATPQELNGTDVSVIRGEIGVAENGCIWIPQNVVQRAAYFICEYLVILLSRDKIVNNMHEAYALLPFSHYGFGTFISGPSKTADIEQALVMGAQSARGVLVILD